MNIIPGIHNHWNFLAASPIMGWVNKDEKIHYVQISPNQEDYLLFARKGLRCPDKLIKSKIL